LILGSQLLDGTSQAIQKVAKATRVSRQDWFPRLIQRELNPTTVATEFTL
jgi:hypothetical protein